MSEPITNEKEMSPEEVEAMRTRMFNYYSQQLPLIRLQREHEMGLADIEEARFRRVEASIKLAHLLRESQEPEVKEERKLKKD